MGRPNEVATSIWSWSSAPEASSLTRSSRRPAGVLWMDEIHFAPPMKPWKIPTNNGSFWFPSGFRSSTSLCQGNPLIEKALGSTEKASFVSRNQVSSCQFRYNFENHCKEFRAGNHGTMTDIRVGEGTFVSRNRASVTSVFNPIQKEAVQNLTEFGTVSELLILLLPIRSLPTMHSEAAGFLKTGELAIQRLREFRVSTTPESP